MNVLLTGATGFIGRHLLTALLQAGYYVRCAQRQPIATHAQVTAVAADFAVDHDPALWLPRLQGIDAVINAVGIFQPRSPQSFDALHVRAPTALFTACAQLGIKRVLQISALGADIQAKTAYHRSKFDADEALLRLPLNAAVVQPSLVYGIDGASSRLFNAWASLPLIPLPGTGQQQIQPIHIDDLVLAMLALLTTQADRVGRVALVGPAPLSLRNYLAQLRAAMSADVSTSFSLGPARFMPVPMSVASAGARVVGSLPGALINRDALIMLQQGNSAEAAVSTQLIGRAPRAVQSFIPHRWASLVAHQALLHWLIPLLVLAMASVWIVTAIVSVAGFPQEQSYELLARTGLHGGLAKLALYGAAAFDLLLGLATLGSFVFSRPTMRLVWQLQIALITSYTLIISVALPEFWLHPFGPILKNLVLLAVLVLLLCFTGAKQRN